MIDGMGSLCYDVDVCYDLVRTLSPFRYLPLPGWGRAGWITFGGLSRRSWWSCEWLINYDCSFL